MRCPFCSCEETKVIDSRTTEDKQSVRRRRECLDCTKRFTTYERIYELPIMIIKSDGRREAFDRNKIIHGLIKACDKRSISVSKIEEIATKIEQNIRNDISEEIPASLVGEAVMDELREIDEVAYVRFASVYRKFTDLERFKEELDGLLRKKKDNK